MNNFIQLNKIENCLGLSSVSLDKILEKGFLIYGDNYKTFTLDVKNFLPVEKSKIESCRILEIDNKFFYVLNKELFEINFSNLSVRKIYATTAEALNPYTDEIVCCGSSNWRTKTQHFSLVKLPNQELFNWEDRRELILISNEFSVFYDGDLQELYAVDLSDNGVKWSLPFDKGISGKRYFQELPNNEVLIQKYFKTGLGNLLKINLETGQIIWEIEQSISFYNYDKPNNKLYGLGSNTFEIINVETGERVMQKELDLHVPPHLTYYTDGYLYFSGYRGDAVTRIFGAVDVNTGEIKFTHTIETPNGEVYRGTYDRPIVVGNRLYVRDQQKTLHIFERTGST